MPMKFRPKLTPVSAALLVILLIIVIWGATYPIAIRLPQNTFQEPLNSSYNVLNESPRFLRRLFGLRQR